MARTESKFETRVRRLSLLPCTAKKGEAVERLAASAPDGKGGAAVLLLRQCTEARRSFLRLLQSGRADVVNTTLAILPPVRDPELARCIERLLEGAVPINESALLALASVGDIQSVPDVIPFLHSVPGSRLLVAAAACLVQITYDFMERGERFYVREGREVFDQTLRDFAINKPTNHENLRHHLSVVAQVCARASRCGVRLACTNLYDRAEVDLLVRSTSLRADDQFIMWSFAHVCLDLTSRGVEVPEAVRVFNDAKATAFVDRYGPTVVEAADYRPSEE